MKRRVPGMTTDQQVEAFLEQDLSDLDFSQEAALIEPTRRRRKP